MIRINLLPPEFRKRSGAGASPETLGVIAGVIVSLAVIGLWGYVQFVRVPHAETELARLDQEFKVAKAEADKVRDLDQKIRQVKARLAMLNNLVQQKVAHAGTISDFADMLGRDRWSTGGFQVAAGGLNVTPASGGGGRRGQQSSDQQFNYRWTMELLGQEFAQTGHYIYTFFTDVKDTDFWYHNGFLGEPVEPYTTEKPEFIEGLGRVKVTHSLLWVRSQNQQRENRKLEAQRQQAARDDAAKGGG